MTIAPEQIEAEIQRREALSRGQSFTSIGGAPAQTQTELPPPGGYAQTPGQGAPLPPQTTDAPGTQGATAAIPPSALDPVEAEIQRREKATGPATDPDSALQRFDQAVLSVVPPGLREQLGAIGRAGANFNHSLTKYLGIAPDAADELLREVGVKLWDKPGSATEAIRSAFRKAGIPVEKTNDFEGQLGRGTFEGMAQSALWFAALPRILALQGSNAVSAVTKKIGEFSARNPGLFTAQNVGAGAGATVAEEDVGGPVATMIGGLVGGMAPSVVGMAARGVTYPVRAAIRAFSPEAPLPPPILRPGSNTQLPREFATAERDAQLARLDAERQTRVAASGPADPQAASTAFARELDASEQAFREEMRRRYAPYADMQVDPSITVNRMARLFRDVAPSEAAGPNFPRQEMEMIDGLYVRRIPEVPAGQPPAAVPFGQPLPPTPQATPARIEIVPTTLDDLINLRSDLQRSAANAAKGGADTPPNLKRARFLQRLAAGVQENIDAATNGTPAEAAVRSASAFATQYFNLFQRGIVGRTYSPMTGRREGATPDEGLTEKMLSTARNRGQDAFAQVAQMADLPPVGMGQYQTLQAAESAVRASFRAAAETSPLGAEQWMNQNRRAIASLTTTAHDLETTAGRLSQIHQIEQGLRRDAIARFIGPDAQNAYAKLYSSPDPAADARRIMMTVGTDADALRGFRSGVVEQLLFATNGSGTSIKSLLSQPKIDRMLREVLDPAEFRRLSRIAELGARMEAGEKTLGGRWTTSGLPIIARIMGAQAGTTIAHMVGRGNIQTPAIVSGIMRNWAADALGGIPPHELVTRAILDPRWEKVLFSKVPADTREAKAFAKNVRRLISTSHAITNEAAPTGETDE